MRAVAAGALLAGAVSACSPTDHRVVLRTLRGELAHQFHECVPLGWNPVAVAGSFYPGSSVVVHEQGVWLPALWLARVRARSRARADVRAIETVLDQLSRAGMLDREQQRWGSTYRLTERALPYFFMENARGNNPDAIPYLCYSTLVPQRVMATSDVHVEHRAGGLADVAVFRATFTWEPSAVAPWASDPVIRAHGVVLGPAESPTVAELVGSGNDWYVTKLRTRAGTPLPQLVDADAWPRGAL